MGSSLVPRHYLALAPRLANAEAVVAAEIVDCDDVGFDLRIEHTVLGPEQPSNLRVLGGGCEAVYEPMCGYSHPPDYRPGARGVFFLRSAGELWLLDTGRFYEPPVLNANRRQYIGGPHLEKLAALIRSDDPAYRTRILARWLASDDDDIALSALMALRHEVYGTVPKPLDLTLVLAPGVVALMAPERDRRVRTEARLVTGLAGIYENPEHPQHDAAVTALIAMANSDQPALSQGALVHLDSLRRRTNTLRCEECTDLDLATACGGLEGVVGYRCRHTLLEAHRRITAARWRVWNAARLRARGACSLDRFACVTVDSWRPTAIPLPRLR